MLVLPSSWLSGMSVGPTLFVAEWLSVGPTLAKRRFDTSKADLIWKLTDWIFENPNQDQFETECHDMMIFIITPVKY